MLARRIGSSQEVLLEGLKQMGFRIDEVLANRLFMEKYGLRDEDIPNHVPESFQDTVAHMDNQVVELSLSIWPFNFKWWPTVQANGSPDSSSFGHLEIVDFIVQVRNRDQLIILDWGDQAPSSDQAPKSIGKRLVADFSMVDYEKWVEAVYERHLRVEFREGEKHASSDKLIVHDCHKPAYDWVSLRRRIEEFLRKTAGADDVLTVATLLGVRINYLAAS